MAERLLRFTGSHGAIECDPVTGNVVTWEEVRANPRDPESGYKHIAKIDLDEWKEWCRSFGGVWEVGGDILYVGYTCFDGSVDPPEHEARNEYVKMREAPLG